LGPALGADDGDLSIGEVAVEGVVRLLVTVGVEVLRGV
jgi:hypothetical protein